MPFCKRYHLLEINDQSWWPQPLREGVQNALSLAWINKLPVIQPTSPAAIVAEILAKILGDRVSEYVYVDFASGAGGPTPYFEQHLNASLREQGRPPVSFVLTDIKPHIPAWSAAAKKSENLSYVAQSVDATAAPSADVLLQNASAGKDKKIMRLFSLSFHHFDDELAADVLKDALETSDGFCIFELVGRDISSVILVSLTWPMLMLQTPFYFLRNLVQMTFTYLVPWIPWVVVFDGYISVLRMRTPAEVQQLLHSRFSPEELSDWRFESGVTQHTWPLGYVHWMACYRKPSQ